MDFVGEKVQGGQHNANMSTPFNQRNELSLSRKKTKTKTKQNKKELRKLIASVKGYCMVIEFGRITRPGAKIKI